MPRTPGPTIRRWQLGNELREAREAARVSIRAAAAEIEVQASTLSKIEGGKQAIKGTYVKLLAPMFGISRDERERLLALAEEANKPGWWVSYGKLVPDWFRLFLGYESDASEQMTYESELVPGLLQDSDYARAVALAAKPDSTDNELDKQVELRRERQQRITGDDPPTVHAVLNEAVLLRKVGGADVMRNQLEHLTSLAKLPHVTVQVLPFDVGAHPAMTAPFHMLGFADVPGMNTVYLENGRGALYLEKPDDLARYRTMFDQLTRLALNPQASLKEIARVMSNL
ncbi:helix-turn-helix domain-containing protein [Actinocrispum wychmicini]|uniref:Helix-turn-helix protein n=1 Tax=Actinocrispum wychmicini TaxID=1213861 RepID=A0A4R2ID04_9PSEU|nr:helix-turn-helix transcriptional regulator [Actinocrispum wychmicini]TCO41649.1 helix-turn-helix protein [Actinocrispum wychmicini]